MGHTVEWARLLCTAFRNLLSFVVDDIGTVKFQIYACGRVYTVGYILVYMIWGGLYFNVCPCHPTFLMNNEHSLIGVRDA